MRSTISFRTISMLGMLTVACVATRPVHYYTIQPASVAPSSGKPDSLVILVGPITAPEALQDGRIHYRLGPNEAGAYEYHRWLERPGTMVHNSLLRALRSSGRHQRVLESSSSATGDYLLRGKLFEFGEVDNAEVHSRISLFAELIDRKTGHNVWDHLAEHEEPVSAKNVTEVVQSLDRNLRQVVSETTTEIEKFLATQH